MKHSLGRSLIRWFTNLIRNSKYRWLIILGSLFYLVSPLDLISDFLPVIGWIDDGIIASIVITELTQFLLEQRRQKSSIKQEESFADLNNSVIDVEAFTVG